MAPGARFWIRTSAFGDHFSAVMARSAAAFQIKRDALLAPVEPNESRRCYPLRQPVIAAGEIPLGPLNLDDPRPGICQTTGRVWCRHRLFDGNNCDTGKVSSSGGLWIAYAAASRSGWYSPRAASEFILARCVKAAWAAGTFSDFPPHALSAAAWSARP